MKRKRTRAKTRGHLQRSRPLSESHQSLIPKLIPWIIIGLGILAVIRLA